PDDHSDQGVPWPHGAICGSAEESYMADKSPRQNLSKKAGKSLKEKRADKHAKADAKNHPEVIPPTKKR
ncbi:MAG: hypothetical protein ACR2HA_14215, partial [Nocardioides sp.]